MNPPRLDHAPPPTSPRGLLDTIYRSRYPAQSPSPAEQLAAIRTLRARLDEEEQQLAFGLRLRGATWSEIAEAAGLGSKQAAQQWFRAAGLLDKLAAAAGKDTTP